MDEAPLWLEALVKSLDHALRFAANEPGWSSVGDETLVAALRGLFTVLGHETAVPSVTPTPDGGLQFEWHDGGWDIEVEAMPDGTLEVWAATLDGSSEISGDLAEVQSDLAAILSRLTVRKRDS